METCARATRGRTSTLAVRLQGKTAIVTGAGSGIGRAIAVAYAQEGARVAVVDIDAAAADETVRQIDHGRSSVFVADVSDARQVSELARRVEREYGGIDILCNNAGLGHDVQSIVDCPEEVWDRVMAVNARGPFLCSKYVIPAILRRGGGAVINIASDLAYLGAPGLGAYCMSKGALVQLTRVLAVEHGRSNIRVNAICPTMVDTPMAARTRESQPDPGAWLQEVERSIPIGRIGRPEEIARVAVFLASDEASFVNGSIFAVDGGRSAV